MVDASFGAIETKFSTFKEIYFFSKNLVIFELLVDSKVKKTSKESKF